MELKEIDLTKISTASRSEKEKWAKVVVDQFYKIGIKSLYTARFQKLVTFFR